MRLMRLVISLLVYFVVVFVGGALLAPWLYWLAVWSAGHWHWHWLAALAAKPFHRFLDRSLLGMAVLGLWPLLRTAGMASGKEIGIFKKKHAFTDLFRGFAVGWVSLAGAALLSCLFGVRVLTFSHDLGHGLLAATMTAIIVAVLEEVLFRGALFGILRKAMPWPAALVISSAIYSLAHFIAKADWGAPVQWSSGLALLRAMMMLHPPFVPAFFTLFVAGLILGLAYQLSGALFFSIGLHAGWIFWLKALRLVSTGIGPRQAFWGSDNLVDGWLSFMILLFLLALMAGRKIRLSGAAP